MAFLPFTLRWFCFLILALGTGRAAAAPADEFPLVAAVESSPRAGLPNFFAKLEAGRDVRIAYFGGSITAQEGWRPKSLAYFKKNYPQASVSQIHAAIGGTGSDLGVFRLRRDVLSRKPDLIFVEFAVNDGGAAPAQIQRCMEGIVRQVWMELPECDLCFVYTLVEGFAPTLQDGKYPRAASVMESIAGPYGIPSIHMGLEVARMAKEGRLIFKGPLPKTDEEKKAAGGVMVFSPDSTHPYPETGHELYLQSIVRSLPAIKAAGTKPGPHTLGAPVWPDHYAAAVMVPLAPAMWSAGVAPLDPAGDKLAKRFGDRVPGLYRATAGQTLTFRFKGTRASVYDVIGPASGSLRITVDNGPPATRTRFDSYCTYERLSSFLIAENLPDTVHTVKIEVLPDTPDKAKILQQRKEKIDDPKRFEANDFFPGALLVVGQVVE